MIATSSCLLRPRELIARPLRLSPYYIEANDAEPDCTEDVALCVAFAWFERTCYLIKGQRVYRAAASGELGDSLIWALFAQADSRQQLKRITTLFNSPTADGALRPKQGGKTCIEEDETTNGRCTRKGYVSDLYAESAARGGVCRARML